MKRLPLTQQPPLRACIVSAIAYAVVVAINHLSVNSLAWISPKPHSGAFGTGWYWIIRVFLHVMEIVSSMAWAACFVLAVVSLCRLVQQGFRMVVRRGA